MIIGSLCAIVAIVCGLVGLVYYHSEYDDVSITHIVMLILSFAMLCIFAAHTPCSDCGEELCKCVCSETICAECGQMLPEKNKECNRKEPIEEPNKCCGVCGQEIVVNIEVNCEHTASVEVETLSETLAPETAKLVFPDCPNCYKGVASAFCPDCGYDMHATINCPSCDKEFKPHEAPLYCPDCGTKIAVDGRGEE